MTRPYSRVIEAVAAIANKLGADVDNRGDRLADNLEAIADKAMGFFVVELTPQAEDFSGTMNHTAAEITEAVDRGNQIIFIFTGEMLETLGYQDAVLLASQYTRVTGNDNYFVSARTLLPILGGYVDLIVNTGCESDDDDNYGTVLLSTTPLGG